MSATSLVTTIEAKNEIVTSSKTILRAALPACEQGACAGEQAGAGKPGDNGHQAKEQADGAQVDCLEVGGEIVGDGRECGHGRDGGQRGDRQNGLGLYERADAVGQEARTRSRLGLRVQGHVRHLICGENRIYGSGKEAGEFVRVLSACKRRAAARLQRAPRRNARRAHARPIRLLL